MSVCNNEDHPAVSVVIPVFNRGDLLLSAIRSCLDQSVSIEVIVVDDGSEEDIQSILRDHFAADLNKRIRFFRQENQGACVARNLGLSHATGRFVKFLDSDDELLPDTLSKEVEFFKRGYPDVVVTGWLERTYNQNGQELEDCQKEIPAPDLSRGIDDMLLGRGPWTAAALYKRSFIQDLRWDPAWTKAQDWGWALTVCLAGATFASLEIPSAVYNHHEGARITSDGDFVFRSSIARQQMLRMVEENLRERGGLGRDRREKLVQYYYKDRVFLCQASPRKWIDLWSDCQRLAPGFVPKETSRFIRGFVRFFGVGRGVQLYVFFKRAYEWLFGRNDV